jgi:hypothetical protein
MSTIKIGKVLLLGMILGVLIMGCGLSSDSDQVDLTRLGNGANVPYNLEEGELPEAVQSIVDVVRQTGGVRAVSTENQQTYVVISMGERPTHGYGIQLQGVFKQSDYIEVRYREKNPGQEEKVDNTPSYPYIVFSIPTSPLPIRFEKI